MTKRHPGRMNLLPGWRLAFVATCVFFAGCTKPDSFASTVILDSELTPQPVRVGPVTVTLKLIDSTSKPISGAHITMEGNMSHPGMAPVFAEAKELDGGRYQGALQLNMPGDWVVLAHVILADGQKLERQINVSGVRRN
jgi:hypothetical protein